MEHQTAVSEVTRTRATVTTISIYFIAVEKKKKSINVVLWVTPTLG